MILYLDMEMTYLDVDADIISIGIVSRDNKKFYAEFTDVSKAKINKNREFLTNNVLNNLVLKSKDDEKYDTNDTRILGDTKRITNELMNWLLQFDRCQFVADCGHYDFALLLKLFGGALNLPKNISPVYIEINNLMAAYFDTTNLDIFDLSRETIAGKEDDEDNKKHNSLFDAMITREIDLKYKLISE